WSDVTLVSRLDYGNGDVQTGATIDRQLDSSTFHNLTIDGYEMAGLIDLTTPSPGSRTFDNRSEITFTGTRSYLNYVNFDTWDRTASCPTLSSVTVTPVSSTSRTLAWTPNGTAAEIQKRYLVRYKISGAQQWQEVDTAGSSVTLSGLTA